MSFHPIAVVGRACVLPGAMTPEALWHRVRAGHDLVSEVDAGRWGIDDVHIMAADDSDSADRTWSKRGGYVRGFEDVFEPQGFALSADKIRSLDPLTQWALHCAREALSPVKAKSLAKTGLVLGNLSFPSEVMAKFADDVWSGTAVDGRGQDRFMSGLPAMRVAEALSLGGEALCLDAACASALYAIKAACDRLQDGEADVMLAGAVNRADDLFIHVGFSALRALSKSGQSRPFHEEADGLVPAEGCVIFALKRLEDAERDGDKIHGVIRGVGLSNDGRSGGFLAPAASGQVRSMRQAYAQSGWAPQEVSLVECHATGTPVGDGVELSSMSEVYRGCRNLPIGSLKSNMGHAITVAGAAGLLKVLESMAHRERPPTLHVDKPLPAVVGTPFRLLRDVEPWSTDGPRRAAVSAFGFGGNNAHLLVEEHQAGVDVALGDTPDRGPVGIVAMEVRAASLPDTPAFTRAVLAGSEHLSADADGVMRGRRQSVHLALAGLRFPPRDLAETLPQQLLMLEVARAAVASAGDLPSERTGVFVGMGTDAEVARYGSRWRLAEAAAQAGHESDVLASARERVVPVLTSAGVVGTMPNIPANRLHTQFDFQGPGFTVSSEELSGLDALKLAARAIRRGELDAALVGAVDMSCEAVHEAAAAQVGLPPVSGDAAVALVLRPVADAEAAGQDILAVLSEEDGSAVALGSAARRLVDQIGHAHAASGLLHVAAAVASLRHGALPGLEPGGRPWLADRRSADVTVSSFGGQSRTVCLGAGSGCTASPRSERPQLFVFAGAALEDVLARVQAAAPGGDGPAKLVIVARSAEELQSRAQAAAAALMARGDVAGVQGVAWSAAPVEGAVAFVFGPAGASYGGAGSDFLLTWPDLAPSLPVGETYAGGAPTTVLESLWTATTLSLAHARWTRGVLGLRPTAVVGCSSGESHGLLAMGAWRDLPEMTQELTESGLFSSQLAGDKTVLKAAWGDPDAAWSAFVVRGEVSRVRRACDAEDGAHVMMIHTDHECTIGGRADAVARVLRGLDDLPASPLAYDLAIHVPEVAAVADAWRALHRRETYAVPGVRFYGGPDGRRYRPVAAEAERAIHDSAVSTVDVPALVRRAYQEGVRIFLEHGPRGVMTRWIREILGDLPHVAVALDAPGPLAGQQHAVAIAALMAAGVEVSPHALSLGFPTHVPATTDKGLVFAAHAAPVVLPDWHKPSSEDCVNDQSADILARPPYLPPVMEGGGVPWGAAAPDEIVAPMDGASILGGGAHPRIVRLPEDLETSVAVHEGLTGPVVTAALDASPGLGSSPLPAVSAAPTRPVSSRVTPTLQSTTAAKPLVATGAPVHASPGQSSALLEMQSRLASTHTAFLEQQRVAHARYLELQQKAQRLLLDARARGVAAPVAGYVATPPPAPSTTPRPAPAKVLQPPVTAAARSVTAKPQASTSPHVARTPKAPEVRSPAAARTETAKALTVDATRPVSQPKVTPTPAAKPTQVQARPGVAQTRPMIPADQLPGLKLDREQLKVHASGKISEIFGPLFEQQDQYARQVRMPEPPLLLADRVVGLDCEAGVLGKGTIWTETDVTEDAWYLHRGKIPAGVMIESGQADLMLISYMGIDFLNQGDRVYRLLGCELTYHGGLPEVGDTLRYDIHVDGHAKHGDVRLFFFHYDCVVNGAPRLTVREGQAGFFTDEELADSDGILWDAATGEYDASARLDAPEIVCERTSFDRTQIEAFAEGDLHACFGKGFEYGLTHNDPPRIAQGRMLFFHRVDALETRGGPWKRGYLRATREISPDDWFFDGHFKNDPCMPGTLMFEGCLQALAFYLASMGFTARRDGWRFQPVSGNPIPMRCRGQVRPNAKVLTYEVFVEEVHDGPVPTIYADLLCTVDGLKAFHARRCGLELAPAWPLERLASDELATMDGRADVAEVDGFRFDYRSMLACAWGRPSEAFGPMYARYDGPRTVPRLPGPPYHFLTRAESLDGPLGGMKVGTRVRVAYDIPEGEWYFNENNQETMPFCVFLEAALQPCGWLASAVGSALTVDGDVYFRNLDGTGTLLREIPRDAGTLITDVTITSISQSGGMIIESFDVTCSLDDEPVYEMKTVFGFFPPKALAQQKGLPILEEHKRWREEPSDFLVDLTGNPPAYCAGSLRLAAPMLRMIDRVTGYWPEAGQAGLGRLRSEKDVDPAEWFFKAHFFQDPVQPGSLGIEAMIQLLQFYMLERGMGEGMEAPRFESLALERPLTWKYRGQVVPANKLISVDLEVTEVGTDHRGRYALAEASLWVDGLRIYSASGLGMRVVDGPPPGVSASDEESAQQDSDEGPWEISLEAQPWLADHRPTWTTPAMPMTGLLDFMARAALSRAPGKVLVGLDQVVARRWLLATDAPQALVAHVVPRGEGSMHVSLEAGPEDKRVRVASGVVQLGDGLETAPEPLAPLAGDPHEVLAPYEGGRLFHGPAFQLAQKIVSGQAGSTVTLTCESTVPAGCLHPALLDAALHGIPHDDLHSWSEAISEDMVAYPYEVRSLRLHAPLPRSGSAVSQARLRELDASSGRPLIDVQLEVDGEIVLSLVLEECLLPKGPIGSAEPAVRQRFLRDREPCAGLGLSDVTDEVTVLSARTVALSDWLPGTVAHVYGVPHLRGDDLVEAVARRDHAAGLLGVHPGVLLDVGDALYEPHRPLEQVVTHVTRKRGEVLVKGSLARHDALVRDWWAQWFGIEEWPVADIYYSVLDRFVGDVVVSDPDGLARLGDRPVIFLGNHQVGIESLVFSILASALVSRPTVTIAKDEHRETWLGKLIQHCFRWPGARDPGVIRYFDRSKAESMAQLLGGLAAELADGSRALMVHVDGTRSLQARQPVRQVSGAFLDLALEIGAVVVPVRFVGGLPVEPASTRLEFPVGYGRQDIWFGAPIPSERLAELPLKDRKQYVLDALNQVGDPLGDEVPADPEPRFAAAVEALCDEYGMAKPYGTIMQVLREASCDSEPAQRLVDSLESGTLDISAHDAEDSWLRGLAHLLLGPEVEDIIREN